MRAANTEDGLFVHRDDVVTVLREMGRSYLEHIPAHAEAGEFLEALLDRHADFILGTAADWFEKGSGDEAGPR